MRALASLLLLSLLASEASAWGPLGHRVVAALAEERLSPRATTELAGLIGDAGLASLSTCADDVLYADKPLDCGRVFAAPPDAAKKTQSWHFINIPSSVDVSAGPSLDAYCPGGECVVGQVHRWTRTLALSSSREERRLALMFLVHLVADAHQPMHALAPDALGEDFKKIDYQGQRKHLHAVWDDLMLAEDWASQSKMDPAPFVARCEQELALEDPRTLSVFSPEDVVLESARLAQAQIASRYSIDHGPVLQGAYRAWFEQVMYRRLALAGARLGVLLERALTHGAAARTVRDGASGLLPASWSWD